MTHNFTYKELFSFGWDKTKAHFPFLLSLLLAGFLIGVFTGGIPIFGSIISGLMTIAMISVVFVILDGRAPHYKDLATPFKTYKPTLHYFLSAILYCLAVIGGLVLLILPGIYIAVRLQFFSYIVVEHENTGPINALKKSWEMTRGKFWKLFGFHVVFFFVNLLGLLLLGVGLLFTIPITALAYAKLYKTLSGHHAPAHEHHEHREHHEPAHLA